MGATLPSVSAQRSRRGPWSRATPPSAPRFHPPFLWWGMESNPAARPESTALPPWARFAIASQQASPSNRRERQPWRLGRAFVALQPMSAGLHDCEVGARPQPFIFFFLRGGGRWQAPNRYCSCAATVARASSFASQMRRPTTGRVVLANEPAAPSPTVLASRAPPRANARDSMWLLSAPTRAAQRAPTMTWRRPRLRISIPSARRANATTLADAAS